MPLTVIFFIVAVLSKLAASAAGKPVMPSATPAKQVESIIAPAVSEPMLPSERI